MLYWFRKTFYFDLKEGLFKKTIKPIFFSLTRGWRDSGWKFVLDFHMVWMFGLPFVITVTLYAIFMVLERIEKKLKIRFFF